MRRFLFLLLYFLCIQLSAGEVEKPLAAPQEATDNDEGGLDFSLGLSAGAAVLDGELYNQIGIRPLFTIGKLGIALDLSLYLDSDGNIRKENWDDANDIWEKFYFIRWAKPGDPFYVKVGAIDDYRLGYGLLVNHYSNTIEYPNVIRTGMELGLEDEGYAFEGMVNNFGEAFDGGGVFAARFVGKFLLGLEVGFSVVGDANQYKGLRDTDGDGVPDEVDDFPHNKRESVDSDGDGVPDSIDPDRDGDGFTDNPNAPAVPDPSYINDDDFSEDNLKGEPFNIDKAGNKSIMAAAVDIGLPIFEADYLQLVLYSQYAQFLTKDGGWGITAPGIRAKFAFINAFAEYRIFGEQFIPEYFNTTYELERAVFRGDAVFTKRQLLKSINEKLQGYVIGADFNIFDLLIFSAEYQDMAKSDIEFKTLRSSLFLNTDIIPKISTAGAYFYQNNTSFGDVFRRTEGTVLGYKFGYEIGGGASLVMDFRQTFRDLNGDGKIKGADEVIKTTLIQTVFMF
jgi:hypothetical protein